MIENDKSNFNIKIENSEDWCSYYVNTKDSSNNFQFPNLYSQRKAKIDRPNYSLPPLPSFLYSVDKRLLYSLIDKCIFGIRYLNGVEIGDRNYSYRCDVEGIFVDELLPFNKRGRLVKDCCCLNHSILTNDSLL